MTKRVKEINNNLAITFAGIEFKNPVYSSHGPLGRTYNALMGSIEAGVGAVGMKSSSMRHDPPSDSKPLGRYIVKPAHMFLNKYGLPKMMLNWESTPDDWTVAEQAKMIKAIKPTAVKHNTKIIAGINIDEGPEPDALREETRILAESGADMIHACLGSDGWPLEEVARLATEIEHMIGKMLKVVKALEEASPIPTVYGLGGPVYLQAGQRFYEAGVRQIEIGDASYGVVVDIEKMDPLVPGPNIFSYGPLRRPCINNITARVFNAHTSFELASSAGVWTANDALERMMCGSTLVGLHTAVQYHGHKILTEIIKGMKEFLDRKGLSVQDIIGVAVPKIVNTSAYEKYLRENEAKREFIRPVINFEKCTACGICANCIHGAINMKDNLPVLTLEYCMKCGICESLCPTDAIALKTNN